MLEIDGQALFEGVRAAKGVPEPRRDLGVVQVGIVAAAGADDLECVGVATFGPAVYEAARLTSQPGRPAVAGWPGGGSATTLPAAGRSDELPASSGWRGAGKAPGGVFCRGQPAATSWSSRGLDAALPPQRRT